MKRKFSTSWKSSKQPRKQRKYLANAPLHIMRKFLSVNLSKELRKKHGKRNVPLRKGDMVKIMRGKFKGQTGKVTDVKTKLQKIYVEKIQVKKQDGSRVNVPLKASNLQITELNLEDRKRKIGKNKEISEKSESNKIERKKMSKKQDNKKDKEEKE